MLPSHGYDFVQWRPDRHGLYESNYLKANSPDGRRGLWLKHNILAPSDGRPALLELWCVLFDQDAGPPRALKQTRPMSELRIAPDQLGIEGDGVCLTANRTKTTVDDGGGSSANWDIKLTTLDRALFHLPHAKMYVTKLPKKKLITPSPRLQFDGKLTFDGETVDVDEWIGIRGHNWGTEHAYCYAYGNCNLFDEDDTALVDMFTAKLKVGPVKTPWLSGGILRRDGRQQDFNRLRHSLTRDATVEWPRWAVSLRAKHRTLHAEWSLDPEQTIGLRYLHPDGQLSFCYNTKFANVNLRLGGTELNSTQGELEFLFADAVPGIPLHGESSV